MATDLADPPAPPAGFAIDKPDAPPTPPAGFKLDSTAAAPPTPPAGFKLDAPEPPAGFKLDAPAQPSINLNEADSKLPQADSTPLLNPAALHQQPAVPVEDVSGPVGYGSYMKDVEKQVGRPLTMVEQLDASQKFHKSLNGPTLEQVQEAKALKNAGDSANSLPRAIVQGAQAMLEAPAAMINPQAVENARHERAVSSPLADTTKTQVGRAIGSAAAGLPAMATGAAAVPIFAAHGAASGAGESRIESQRLRESGTPVSGTQEAAAAIGQGVEQGAENAIAAKAFKVAKAIPGGIAGRVAGQLGVNVGTAQAGTVARNAIAQQTNDPNRPLTQGMSQATGSGALQGMMFAAMGELGHMFKGNVPPEHVDALAKAESPEQIEQVVNNARAKLAQATLPVNEQIRGKIEGATNGNGSTEIPVATGEGINAGKAKLAQEIAPNAVGAPSSAAPPTVEQRVLENQPGREAAGLPGNVPSGESSPVAQPPASPPSVTQQHIDAAKEGLDSDATPEEIMRVAKEYADEDAAIDQQRAEEKQANESDYQQASKKRQQRYAVKEQIRKIADSAGWKLQTTSEGSGGFGSHYLTLTNPDTGAEINIRIADHYAPSGSGFDLENQKFHDAPDANFVLDENGNGFDPVKLQKKMGLPPASPPEIPDSSTVSKAEPTQPTKIIPEAKPSSISDSDLPAREPSTGNPSWHSTELTTDEEMAATAVKSGDAGSLNDPLQSGAQFVYKKNGIWHISNDGDEWHRVTDPSTSTKLEKWSSTGATPIDPLEPVVSKAERDILSAPLDETPEPPKLDTAAGDGGEKPLTTGIAQRVTNIEAGQGIAPEAAVEQGRKLLASGADPNTAFDDSRPLDESLGLARAHEEVLAKAANRAADEHGVSSSEYRAANKEQMAWREKIKPLQTRWSRAGAVQQGETEIDTGTFHGLHQAYQERTGKEFTPAQAESAKRTAAEVKQKNDAADAAKQKLYDAVGSSEASPQTKSLADRIVAKLDKAADDALARFRKRHTATVTSGVDPADLADLSIYGAAKIAKGVTRFAEWSAEMVKDVGESIRPHLQAIFDASDKELDRHVAGESAHEENVQRSKTKPLGKTATPEEIGKRLSDKSTPGQLSIIAKHLSRVFIRDGITERDANVDAVHKVISGRIPEFTREQTSDAMSGYGDFRRLSKDPIEVRRREISGEIQQVRKLQDMSEGKAPKKSGVERQAPTDEARRLTAQVNEAKKRGGYTTTDPTTQLKSALDARKTWTRNRMADMRREIAAGVKDAKTRGAGPSDPELVKLRTEYEKVKADYLATFGEPSRKMTDAQRLKAATTSAERSLEDLQRRVNESDFSTDKRKPVSSPRLESLRAKVDEVRAQLAELKGLDPASMQTAAQKSDAAWLRKLTSDHAKLTARLSDPSLSDVGKKSRVTFDPEVQAAQDRNDAIREQIASNKGAAVTAEKAKAATDLIRSHPAGTKMTPERVRALWADAKTNYIEKGVTNFDDIVNKLATDHGLPVNDIRRGLAQPKGAREITNEMYAKQADARRTIQNAKQWVQNAGKPRLQRGLEALPRLFFTAKVFGHGTVGMITHAGNQIFNPGEARSYWTNFARQFKLMGVHDAGAFHEQAMADLQRRPNYVTARRAGLVNDPTKFADDYQKTSVAKFLGKIGLTGSRGFDALKLFRQDLFDHQWDGLPASLKTPDMAKEIADSANHATGTVKANVGGKVAAAAVFAPKLEGSRWAFLVGDPAKAAKRFANWKNETPEARSSAIREVKQKAIIAGTYFGALAINQAMLSATGSSQKVNFTDPTKPDFLGFKVAGHNVSVVSPMIGTVRFLSDLARFPFESRKDLRGDEPLGAAGERSVKYLRGKLSPFAKPIADTYSGSDYSGRPMPWSNAPVPKYLQREGVGKISYGEYAAETVLPIPVESAIKEAWKSQGMSDNDIARWMKAITVGAVEGSTGARVSQDEPQSTPPQKHIASPSRSGFLHATKPARVK